MSNQLFIRYLFLIGDVIKGILWRYEYLNIYNSIICIILLSILICFRNKYLDNDYITSFIYAGSLFIFPIIIEWNLGSMIVHSIFYFFLTVPIFFYLKKKR